MIALSLLAVILVLYTQSRIYSKQLPCYAQHGHNAEQICKHHRHAHAGAGSARLATMYGLLAPHMHAAWRDHRLQPSRSDPSCIRSYIPQPICAILAYPDDYTCHRISVKSIVSYHIAAQRIAAHAHGAQWRRLAVLRSLWEHSGQYTHPTQSCCPLSVL